MVLLAPTLRGEQAGAATAGASVKKSKVKYVTASYPLMTANETPRLEVLCPRPKKFRFPYGGFMWGMPGPLGGEGVYPHSFERLGVQGGYHVTPVLFDMMPPVTARTVILGTVCGPDPGKANAVHTFAQIPAGGTATATATCPGKRRLFAGGFNLFTFTGTGGTYPTDAEAVDAKTWTVTGAAFGNKGGQFAAIAYCRKGKGVLELTEATTTILPGGEAYVTTPACPRNTFLVAGGIATNPDGSILFADSRPNPDQTYTIGGHNRSAAPATLEAYGYCLDMDLVTFSARRKF